MVLNVLTHIFFACGCGFCLQHANAKADASTSDQLVWYMWYLTSLRKVISEMKMIWQRQKDSEQPGHGVCLLNAPQGLFPVYGWLVAPPLIILLLLVHTYVN